MVQNLYYAQESVMNGQARSNMLPTPHPTPYFFKVYNPKTDHIYVQFNPCHAE